MMFGITLLNIFLNVKVNFMSLASELCCKNKIQIWAVEEHIKMKSRILTMAQPLKSHVVSLWCACWPMQKVSWRVNLRCTKVMNWKQNAFLCIKCLLETVDNLKKSNDFLSVLEWTVKSPSEILTFTQSWAAELESPYNSWRLLIPKEKQP